MSKNIPITARINKGLFGSKVSEPVLNVGQAGVSGNNQTRNTPAPAKMMSSPFKQLSNPLNKNGSSESRSVRIGEGKKIIGVNKSVSVGKDIYVPGAAGTTNVDAVNKDKKNLGPTYRPSAAETRRANKELADAKAKDEASTTPGTTIKGEDKEELKEFNPEVQHTGDSKRPWERRWDSRGTKKTGRDVRQSENKGIKIADKVAKFEKNNTGSSGNFAEPKAGEQGYKKYARLKVKERENSRELEGFKGALDMSIKQQEQSADKGTKIRGNKEDATLVDLGGVQTQLEQAKGDKVDSSKITGTSISSPKEVPVEKVIAKEKEKQTEDTPSSVGKKTNGFFGKKSPMKMKYFK